jgi:thiamine biosynthesis lipoprotein
VRLDLGGIAKGYAVDVAAQALRRQGCQAGWVNAGGDLCTFGDCALTLQLRDEARGGVRNWGRLQDGACATSHFAQGSRSALSGAAAPPTRHLSVLAPRCLWADALTKVAALEPTHRLLRAFGASAVWH